VGHRQKLAGNYWFKQIPSHKYTHAHTPLRFLTRTHLLSVKIFCCKPAQSWNYEYLFSVAIGKFCVVIRCRENSLVVLSRPSYWAEWSKTVVLNLFLHILPFLSNKVTRFTPSTLNGGISAHLLKIRN